MDYCSSCRRSLNGALVCPGCGDYAPDIAPPNHRRQSAMGAAAMWESWPPDETPAPGPRRGRYAEDKPLAGDAPFAGDAAGVAGAAGIADDAPFARGTSAVAEAGSAETAAALDADAPGEDEIPAPTGQGRAARRRQMARWKKHRRRAAAATAFALVGGGLTVSMLQNKPATNGTHASSMPEPESVSTPRTEPAASSADRPDQSDSQASRHPGARPSLPSGRHARPDTNTPPPASTAQQPHSVTPSHTATPPSAGAPASEAHPAHTDAAAPATSAPAATGGSGGSGSGSGGSGSGGSGADTSPADTAPAAPEAKPSSPTHLCLLGVVCVG
ncbi:SCO2400 family protein [Streptomyces tubercidicus]